VLGDSQDSQEYWLNLKREIRKKFGFEAISENEYDVSYDLKQNFSNSVEGETDGRCLFFRRLCHVCGMFMLFIYSFICLFVCLFCFMYLFFLFFFFCIICLFVCICWFLFVCLLVYLFIICLFVYCSYIFFPFKNV
jgi:hypothetical protein